MQVGMMIRVLLMMCWRKEGRSRRWRKKWRPQFSKLLIVRSAYDIPRRHGDTEKHCDSPCLCTTACPDEGRVVQKIIAYLNNSFKPKSFYMKKLFFILTVVILNSLIACNSG